MDHVSKAEHIGLYRMLRTNLRRDLVAAGVPNPVAGTILNWFDPACPEYLAHVDAWQKTLCAHWNDGQIPFIPLGTLWSLSPRLAAMIQQVAKLVYKYHGQPAKKTDWSAVENRLAHALPITLKDVEIRGIRRILSRIQAPDLNSVVGRFGPGATAEGFTEFEKWSRIGHCPDVPPALYRVNPNDPWQTTTLLSFRMTKVSEVPKTIKANRIVSAEPAMSMYAQLAINDDLVAQIHRLFRGHVSLHDQRKHNEYLYMPEMVTLDLSDASDHVSTSLVERVLPQLWPILAKVRSEYTQFPTGQVVQLNTFAPMGAGFCFSVMTTVILGIIAYAYEEAHRNWKVGHWSVYGDDIILDNAVADIAEDLLTRAGLVINEAKSCYSGDYVESCGLELYHFHDITPAYIRDPLELLGADKVDQIAGKLSQRGFLSTAKQILDLAQPAKGWRYNKDLQEWMLLVKCPSARKKLVRLDGFPGLNRWFSLRTQQEVRILPDAVRTEDPKVCDASWVKMGWRFKPSHLFPAVASWALDMCPPKGKSR